MSLDKELQGQVDAQLLEQGSFAVLDFLIEAGRLLPDDYERWRRGELDSLDAVLMGSTEKIRRQVESVAGYARSIGLVPEQQVFHAWRPDTEPGAGPLRASTNAALNALIASRFVPAQTAPQLDLFFDNPVVALTNGIVRALSAGDPAEAQRALDRLYDHAPNHADLPGYDRLLDSLRQRARPIAEPRHELAALLQLAPTARRLLGSQARDVLTPRWRELAAALSGRAFDPGEPELHRSFSLCQAQDWPAVTRCVHDEPRWWLHAPLCLRLAQSSFHQRHRDEALTAWFQLCWNAPREACAVLDNRRHPDTGIAASWQRFVDGATADAEGSDGALETGDFPAWLLLQEPGLTRQLAVDLSAGATPAEESYRRVHRWIEARREGRQNEELALRKTLQATNPRLFDCLKRSL